MQVMLVHKKTWRGKRDHLQDACSDARGPMELVMQVAAGCALLDSVASDTVMQRTHNWVFASMCQRHLVLL